MDTNFLVLLSHSCPEFSLYQRHSNLISFYSDSNPKG